jgi:peptidyl-prolyl cis-trans isomerase D
MISGSNPDQQIQRQFVGADGQFDRSKLNQFLSYLQTPKADPKQLEAWAILLSNYLLQKNSKST